MASLISPGTVASGKTNFLSTQAVEIGRRCVGHSVCTGGLRCGMTVDLIDEDCTLFLLLAFRWETLWNPSTSEASSLEQEYIMVSSLPAWLCREFLFLAPDPAGAVTPRRHSAEPTFTAEAMAVVSPRDTR
ncbi:hypothetical protein HPB50_003862 [Hyalomma asiaticum]|uniref:Uncharacterized protein n=1 Tax=Hyalomma asiaticum TaxID=266040 RepID=A0ACB7T635_HYAAI|nr:hypothetical protein HPB50_003862 [Hyalomma asiaticum]